MWDAVYVIITLLFFAAMLWYVSGCQRLGGDSDASSGRDDIRNGDRRSGGPRDER